MTISVRWSGSHWSLTPGGGEFADQQSAIRAAEERPDARQVAIYTRDGELLMNIRTLAERGMQP